jgi:hypothetical protein
MEYFVFGSFNLMTGEMLENGGKSWGCQVTLCWAAFID